MLALVRQCISKTLFLLEQQFKELWSVRDIVNVHDVENKRDGHRKSDMRGCLCKLMRCHKLRPAATIERTCRRKERGMHWNKPAGAAWRPVESVCGAARCADLRTS